MRTLLAASTLIAGLSWAAHGANLITFSPIATSNEVTATNGIASAIPLTITANAASSSSRCACGLIR